MRRRYKKRDYEKCLFALQDTFKKCPKLENLSEIYIKVKEYCQVLFRYLRYEYDDLIATSISDELTMDKLFKGQFIDRSWKAYIIPRIKAQVRLIFNLVPLSDYEVFFNENFVKDKMSLLEKIEWVLRKYMSTLDLKSMMCFLYFLRSNGGELTESWQSFENFGNGKSFKVTINTWLLVFRRILKYSLMDRNKDGCETGTIKKFAV